MLGGYQILDLRNIDLSRSTTASNITDVEVLKQLSYIADHIQKNYDFNKPLHNQLKPLLIRYRDKKVGEKHEVALYGNIEVINVYYKFKIIAQNNGEKLTIDVEFEEKTDEYDNKYFAIKTATILLTSEVAIFENITDKDGHKRFDDFDGIGIEQEGIEILYNKASLSGTHLLIVFAVSVSNGTTIAVNSVLTTIKLPQWILDKIVPIQATLVTNGQPLVLRGTDWSYQSGDVVLEKQTDGVTITFVSENLEATADRKGRVQIDLLIDDE